MTSQEFVTAVRKWLDWPEAPAASILGRAAMAGVDLGQATKKDVRAVALIVWRASAP